MIIEDYSKLIPGNFYLVGIKVYDGATYTIYQIYAKFVKTDSVKKYGKEFFVFDTHYSQIKTSKIKKLFEVDIYNIIDDVLELENFCLRNVYKIDE